MKTPLHLEQPPQVWRLVGEADRPDPLLLARVLQRVTVPEIELETATYERNHGRVELQIRCSAARAMLSRQRLEKLVALRRTDLVAVA